MTVTQQQAIEQQQGDPVSRWARFVRVIQHWNKVLAGI
jgi:hypothetical protein